MAHSKFTEEIALQICELISDGLTTRQVCAQLDIPKTTFNRWLNSIPSFRDQYARAKEQAMDDMADEILEIADDGTGDRKTEIGRDGREYEVIDNEVLQRSRLRVDTRKWLMAKLAPKKYSDKHQVEHSGEVSHSVTVNIREKGKPE